MGCTVAHDHRDHGRSACAHNATRARVFTQMPATLIMPAGKTSVNVLHRLMGCTVAHDHHDHGRNARAHNATRAHVFTQMPATLIMPAEHNFREVAP